MTMQSFSQWLNRTKSGPKPKRRLPKMSSKRQRENRIYLVKRRAFLEAHPLCQAWATIVFSRHALFVGPNTSVLEVLSTPVSQPQSTEIHHTKKPKCKYYLDESTWLAVCRWSHRWIEDHKDLARELGLLQ
jgi:hypothetical protein